MTKQTQTYDTKPSRKEALINALSRKKPPTVTTLAETLSLQPHSVRAAISGLRKAGFEIETIKSPSGGAATYRMAVPGISNGAQ